MPTAEAPAHLHNPPHRLVHLTHHCAPSLLLPQSQGFEVDGKVRTIPLEIMVQGDKEPVYEETLEENGR